MAYLGHIFPRLPTPFAHSNGVVIRTNGGELEVDAEHDTVKHYGKADSINIVKVASTSYREHGEVGYAQIANGRLVVEEDAKIDGIYLVANETTQQFDGIKLAVVGNAELPSIARADVTLTNGQSKLVVEVQTLTTSESTDNNPEYVWITKTNDVTETAVSSSATSADQTVETPSAAATSASNEVEESTAPITDNTVARIGAIGYESFNEAVEVAKKGEKIYLLKSFTLSNNVGDFSNNEVYSGLYEGSLANEVILCDDIEITFNSFCSITLTKSGKFNLNGHKLSLVGSSNGCGIYNCQKLFDNAEDHNIIGYTVNGNKAIVTEDLIYSIESEYAPLMFTLVYSYDSNNNLKWNCGNALTIGGYNIDVRSMEQDAIKMGEYTLEYNQTQELRVNEVAGATYSWINLSSPSAQDMLLPFVGVTNEQAATIRNQNNMTMNDVQRYIGCDVFKEDGSWQRYYWIITLPAGMDFDFDF